MNDDTTEQTVEAPPRMPWIQFLGNDVEIDYGDTSIRYRQKRTRHPVIEEARNAERQLSAIASLDKSRVPSRAFERLRSREQECLLRCEDEIMETMMEAMTTIYRAYKAQREGSE